MNFLVIISPTSRELVLLAWQSPAPSCCALSQYSLASTGLGKENIVEMEKNLSLARLKRINNFNIYHVFKSKGFLVCSSCLFQKQLFPVPCPGGRGNRSLLLASWVHGWVRALDRVTGGQQGGWDTQYTPADMSRFNRTSSRSTLRILGGSSHPGEWHLSVCS